MDRGGPAQIVVGGKNHQMDPLYFDESFSRVFKLTLLHGDAAFAGQGAQGEQPVVEREARHAW